VRDRVPVSSQVFEYPPHDDHGPSESLPQDVPSVSRLHDPDSVVVELWQVPAPQVYDVRDRVRDPLSSHVPE